MLPHASGEKVPLYNTYIHANFALFFVYLNICREAIRHRERGQFSQDRAIQISDDMSVTV